MANRLATRSAQAAVAVMVVWAMAGAAVAAEASPQVQARAILRAANVQGGLVVHVGCGDGGLTAALRAGDAYLVHGLDTDADNVAKARETIAARGLYGPVSVDVFDGRRLPHVDNLVNLIVAEDPGGVPMAEVLRVLAPEGVAYIGGKKTVKPRPDDIDDWPQYLHGADNNAVAHDAVVGPPRHLQWVTDPSWSRSHMAISTVVSMVTAGGRLFTVEDRATPENPFLPGRFALVARGAFNGLVLWQRELADWEPVTRYIKDIAMQLQRRLVATGDIVYATPGLSAPVTAFEAATGKVLRTYAGTERTQELALADGVLYLVIGDRMNAARYNIVKTYSGKGVSTGGSDPKAPFDGTGWRGAYAAETPDKADPTCAIAAVEAASGRELWRIKDIHGYTGCSLAARGQNAVYQTGRGLVCLDPKTGAVRWDVKKPIRGGDGTEANTVVLGDDAVYAQEGKTLCVYALADGSKMWEAPIASCYEKPADLFLAAGAVWTGGAGPPTAYDPKTGRKGDVIRQRMTGPMGHDRCYRNFITDRFYINSKTGGADFVALDGGKEFPHHWTRGTCGMGVLPANGLLYAPPYSCQCSIDCMVVGFNAYAPEPGLESPGQDVPVEASVRLVKGPAYGAAGGPARASGSNPKSEASDWPTYRHDGSRGGATAAEVPPRLAPLWKTPFRTATSAPVVADGKVFVAEVDAHAVHALDADTGQPVWAYTAGGRVDSPPTVYGGLVLFGSRDGWVHAVRASDGALAWRFKDLPDRLIGAHGQLESAWPVSGSVLVLNGVVYFAAGRSSFLDGGIVLYGVKAGTGEVVHRRRIYGPFDAKSGFPKADGEAFKADVFVADGRLLYLRHKALKPDLSDAASPGRHVIASAGFLDSEPQHRTYWKISTAFLGRLGPRTVVREPNGDVLATDGTDCYMVQGFPVHRHSYFDPRVSGYRLVACAAEGRGDVGRGAKGKKGKGKTPRQGDSRWNTAIPLTGKAMVLAGDVVFVAGTPAYFPPDHAAAKYVAAYEGKLGGVLWAASAKDGSKLAEVKLDAAPVWDGMAAAGGRLFLATVDGCLRCFGPAR